MPDSAAARLELDPQSTRVVRLRLRVKTGAARDAILGVHAGALKLSVTAAPERGKANRAVLALLGEALGIAPSSIELVAGAASHDKTVLVPLGGDAVRQRLGGALP